MKKILIGKKKLGPKVDIADPYYGRDEGERKNDLPLREGVYNCSVVIADDAETCGMGERVSSLWLEPDVPAVFAPNAYKKICDVGVDTAMLSVFASETVFTKDKLWELSDKIIQLPELAMILDEGIICKSGYGDGYYPVYGVKNKNGEYVALRVQFI